MRRASLVTAIVVALAAPAAAQTAPPFSVLGGVTWGSPQFGGSGSFSKSKPGFIGGVSFEKPFNDTGRLIIQGLYHQVNFWIDDTSEFQNYLKVQIAYLNVPVLIGFKPNEHVTLFGGADFGFELSHTETDVAAGASQERPDDLHSLEGGVNAGLALGGQINFKWMYLEVLWKLGLTNMASGDNLSNFPDANVKIRSISFLAGFPIGKR
jgi:hypothetical protein